MAQALCDLPEPVLARPTPAEAAAANEKFIQCCEAEDLDGIAALASVIPLSAETLDDIKRRIGLDYLLEYRFNLSEAIEKYGMGWLK